MAAAGRSTSTRPSAGSAEPWWTLSCTDRYNHLAAPGFPRHAVREES
jgi:hypothetical protein